MDNNNIIKSPISSDIEDFEKLYNSLFHSDILLLDKALNYVMTTSGKMMRPILLILTSRSLGMVTDATHRAAATLELLHTASLLHDDVVDKSDMRRGLPSLNAVFSNRISILTGDYLFSLSLQNAALTGMQSIIEGISLLGQTLASGELLQLQVEGDSNFSEEKYLEIIRRKTASLFEACGRFGAITAGANGDVVDRFAKFGQCIGICFQLKDDLFDYFDSNNIGKPTGADMREGKFTLPALYVMNNSSSKIAKHSLQKLNCGETLNDEEILSLIDISKKEGGVDYAMKRIENFKNEAFSLLPTEIDAQCREALIAYLSYAINRTK